MGLKNRLNDYFVFGCKKGDIALMLDFSRKRAIVRANTALIEGGVALEKIPEGVSGYSRGMVLIKKGWHRQYFLKERESWTDDDYFDHRGDYNERSNKYRIFGEH